MPETFDAGLFKKNTAESTDNAGEHGFGDQFGAQFGARIDIPTLLASNAENLNSTRRFDRSSPTAKAYLESRPAVAHIETLNKINPDDTITKTDGSGFFVTDKGMLATAYHVIKDAAHGITVTTGDGIPHTATIQNLDTAHDLALLKVQPLQPQETFATVDLAKDSKLNKGEEMTALGFPKRSDITHVSPGKMDNVTSLNRFGINGGLFPNEDPHRPMLKTDMTVEAGNSGGPLIDANGQVAGIVDLNVRNQDTTISTPVEDLHAFLKRSGVQPKSGER